MREPLSDKSGRDTDAFMDNDIAERSANGSELHWDGSAHVRVAALLLSIASTSTSPRVLFLELLDGV
jgi:hypothetical protein